MKPDDFLILPDPIENADSDWVVASTTVELNRDLIDQIRRGPLPSVDDLNVAIGLTRLVHEEFLGHGTSGADHFDNDQSAQALRGLKAILKRLGVKVDFPFRDFSSFYAYWSANGMSGGGGWAARRVCLAGIFEPIYQRLEELEDQKFANDLAEPVAGDNKTGWDIVDTEVRELRRRYHNASTTQDFRDVGNRCVGVLEALSAAVFDPTLHLLEGEEAPHVNKTKFRIGRYVETKLAGKDDKLLRDLIIKASELAHGVKHGSVSGKKSASIAADTVILLVSILTRLED